MRIGGDCIRNICPLSEGIELARCVGMFALGPIFAAIDQHPVAVEVQKLQISYCSTLLHLHVVSGIAFIWKVLRWHQRRPS